MRIRSNNREEVERDMHGARLLIKPLLNKRVRTLLMSLVYSMIAVSTTKYCMNYSSTLQCTQLPDHSMAEPAWQEAECKGYLSSKITKGGGVE